MRIFGKARRMRPRGIGRRFGGLLIGACLTGGGCSPAPDRAAADTGADTAYLVAAFRIEAQARLDHLAVRLARLRLAAEHRAEWAPALDTAEARRARLADRIRAFAPEAADFTHASGALVGDLDALRRDIDQLAGRLAGPPPEAPR